MALPFKQGVSDFKGDFPTDLARQEKPCQKIRNLPLI